ncbi:MAG: ATP-binding protein, partial [bacterium]
TKDGKEFPVDISLSPVETAEGLFVLADIRDITERKRAEGEIKRGYVFQSTISRLLQTSLEPIPFENQLSLILDTILSIPFLLQPKGCIYLAEDSTLKMKVQRGLPREMLSACAEVPFGRCLCGLAASTCEIVCASCVDDRHEARYEEMSPHGNYCIPIASGTRVLGVINLVLTEGLTLKKQEEELLSSVANTLAGIVERNTAEGEKRRLQEQLVLAEKLAALGRLAANVAHEIRNPLTAIGGYARRLDRHLSPETSGKNYTGIIISEVSRLEKILKNVLVYSRESSLDLERSDVNEIIEESLKIFEPVCAERSIEIRKSLAHIPEIMTDRERIKEVINNLISNAIDSMPRGGILGIITTEETLKERPYLSVKVTDTGQGIPGDKLKMIFEPFFTTKVLEQGTGLGLAISKKIVEDHGGFIGVESTVGKGSMLTFHLPYQRP